MNSKRTSYLGFLMISAKYNDPPAFIICEITRVGGSRLFISRLPGNSPPHGVLLPYSNTYIPDTDPPTWSCDYGISCIAAASCFHPRRVSGHPDGVSDGPLLAQQ